MVKKNPAFTLFEILIVVGIIGFLMAFFIPTVMNYFGRTERKKIEFKLNKVKQSLILYKQDMGHYPLKKEGGLQALLQRPNVPGSERWSGPYLNEEDDLLGANNIPFEFNVPPVKYKNRFQYFEIFSEGTEEGQEFFQGF